MSRYVSDLYLIHLMHVLTSPIATTCSTVILGHVLRSWSDFHQERTCLKVFWEAGDYQVLHDALLFLALSSLIPQQDCYCGNLNRPYCNNIFRQRAMANLAIEKKEPSSHTKALFLKYTPLKILQYSQSMSYICEPCCHLRLAQISISSETIITNV